MLDRFKHVLILKAREKFGLYIFRLHVCSVSQFLNNGGRYLGVRLKLLRSDGKHLKGLLTVLEVVLDVVEVLRQSQVIETDLIPMLTLRAIHIKLVILVQDFLLILCYLRSHLALVIIRLNDIATPHYVWEVTAAV